MVSTAWAIESARSAIAGVSMKVDPWGMGHPRIFLFLEDDQLAMALTRRLVLGIPDAAPVRGNPLEEGAVRGDIVLTTPTDCPPAHCAEAVARGFHVIVLAPVRREAERIAYTDTGALRYMVMRIEEMSELIEAVREAVALDGKPYHGAASSIPSSAASIQSESPSAC